MDLRIPIMLPCGSLQCDAVNVDEKAKTATVRLAAVAASAACPSCHTDSRSMHSRYDRIVMDLPSVGYQLSLRITVRRFRCCQSDCSQRIFTEQMPELVKPRQRRTNRLARLQTNLALDVGASAGRRICVQIGAPTSVDSLLRLKIGRAHV